MKNEDKPKRVDATVEFVARIKYPDGTVVEKTSSVVSEVPTLEDFDLSTREGIIADFDALEQAILLPRNQSGSALATEIMRQAAKKNKTAKEPAPQDPPTSNQN